MIDSRVDESKMQLINALLQADDDTVARVTAAIRGRPQATKTITIGQAAEILGTCRRTVDRYAHAGKIRRIVHSLRRIRYDLADVERLAFEGIDEG